MPLRILLFAGLCPLLLTACIASTQGPKVVLLKHPETLDFQECSVDDWGSREGFASKEHCVKQWQDQGYIIWGAQ